MNVVAQVVLGVFAYLTVGVHVALLFRRGHLRVRDGQGELVRFSALLFGLIVVGWIGLLFVNVRLVDE